MRLRVGVAARTQGGIQQAPEAEAGCRSRVRRKEGGSKRAREQLREVKYAHNATWSEPTAHGRTKEKRPGQSPEVNPRQEALATSHTGEKSSDQNPIQEGGVFLMALRDRESRQTLGSR